MLKMAGAGVSDGTILDYLNEDCWQVVLGYVPVCDIILTERVSRQWQAMVQGYLQSVRISIEMETREGGVIEPLPNVRRMTLHSLGDCKSFRSWLQKLGPSVVAVFCNTKRIFRAIVANCPNIESLTFVGLKRSIDLQPSENTNRLRRLHFMDCEVLDRFITQFTRHNYVLEELGLHFCDNAHGSHLSHIGSANFKSLIFQNCLGLISSFLISALDRLGGLRKLGFIVVPRGIYEQVQCFLDKMPLLQRFTMCSNVHGLCMAMKNYEYMESVCALGELEHLALYYDVTDEDLEAVTQRCPRLHSLEFNYCNAVTSAGAAAACRGAGARLTALGAPRSRLTDDDVLDVIQRCPNLTWLSVRQCAFVSAALAARAAAARRVLRARRPLRLLAGDTRLWHDLDTLEEFKEIIIEY